MKVIRVAEARVIADTNVATVPNGLFELREKVVDPCLVARIVAVIDVYDALGSERPYKKPFPEEKCQEILREGAGSHFDPEIIQAFFDNIDEIVRIKRDWRD